MGMDTWGVTRPAKSQGPKSENGFTMKVRRCAAPPASLRLRFEPQGWGEHELRMNCRIGLKSWATGALVLGAVSACGSTSARSDPPESPPVTVTSPSLTSPSDAPTSPAQSAATDAVAVMRRYFTVLDSARKAQSVPVSRLESVMTSIELTTEQRLVAQERQQGDHQVGDTRIARLTVRAVDLRNSDPAMGKVPTVTIDVCWDVSKADLLDKNGQSIVSPSRAARGWTRYTVANYHWSENPSGGWRVADGQDLKQTPCTAS